LVDGAPEQDVVLSSQAAATTGLVDPGPSLHLSTDFAFVFGEEFAPDLCIVCWEVRRAPFVPCRRHMHLKSQVANPSVPTVWIRLVVESRMYQALLTPPTSKHTLGQRAFLRKRGRHAQHPYTTNEVLGPTVGQRSCESMRKLFLSGSVPVRKLTSNLHEDVDSVDQNRMPEPKGIVTRLGCRRLHGRSGAPSAKVHLPARETSIPNHSALVFRPWL